MRGFELALGALRDALDDWRRAERADVRHQLGHGATVETQATLAAAAELVGGLEAALAREPDVWEHLLAGALTYEGLQLSALQAACDARDALVPRAERAHAAYSAPEPSSRSAASGAAAQQLEGDRAECVE